ncbi:MAG: hypothetical protein LBD59_12730, partial [Prevotellaceae bacterium]|jgi:hypothetical protein|nr:hypothetical protein [Prevotellaceae bacterium]
MWGDLRERLGGFVLNIVNNVLPALKGLLEWLDRNGAAIKTMLKLVATGVIGYYSYKLAVSLCTVSLKSFAAGSLFARMASIALHHGVRGLARAFLFLNAVTKVSIIGALISAVTVAISLFAMFRKRVDDGTAAMKRAKETAEGYYAQEKSGLDMLFDKLKKTNPKSEDRNRLVDELKRMYPELNSQMEQELRTTNNLSTAYEALTASIVKKARIKGMEAAIEDAVGKTSGFDMAIEGLVAKAPVAEREGLRTKYWDEIKRLVAADGRYSVGQSAKFSEQWQKDLMAATVFSIDSELGMSAILSPKGAKAIASARRGYFFCISKKRCIFAA